MNIFSKLTGGDANDSKADNENEALGRKVRSIMNSMKFDEMLKNLPGAQAEGDGIVRDHSFWIGEPVKDYKDEIEADGPFVAMRDTNLVPQEEMPLLNEFEWSLIDITDEKQLNELQQLISKHYVETEDAISRVIYNKEGIRWILSSPGYKQKFHIGVRVKANKKLVGFISGVPMVLRVREAVMRCAAITFLCVHRKLRDKKLTPVLIHEIQRKYPFEDVWQAVFTATHVLPSPLASTRIMHRCLNWSKLYAAGFSAIDKGMTKEMMIQAHAPPDKSMIPGFRSARVEDIPQISILLRNYLSRFEIAQMFSNEEVEHWLISKHDPSKNEKPYVHTYVVEDSEGKITDMMSFYTHSLIFSPDGVDHLLEMGHLTYYATTVAELGDREKLKNRLLELANDVSYAAAKINIDVLNCYTILDNTLFANEAKYDYGGGQLNYYMYNYIARPFKSGMKPDGTLDPEGSSVGLIVF